MRRARSGPQGRRRRTNSFGAQPRPAASPVVEGNVYEAKIEDIGREGDGLCRVDNFVVFVPGAKVGDTVKFRVTKVLRRVAFGEVVHEGGGAAEAPPPAGDSKGVE